MLHVRKTFPMLRDSKGKQPRVQPLAAPPVAAARVPAAGVPAARESAAAAQQPAHGEMTNTVINNLQAEK
jgi:hypothetical protein